MYKDTLLTLTNEMDFEREALLRFEKLMSQHDLYSKFVHSLFGTSFSPTSWREIPCVPVSFFKDHNLYRAEASPEAVFTSSGTTGSITSKHPVEKLSWYHEVSKTCFERIYGNLQEWNFLCLLPSYLEREGSSLIEMCRYFIEHSGKGGFFLTDHNALLEQLRISQANGQKTMLIGVSFALLDLAESFPDKDLFKDLVVMETGGMKGRRKEITRMELHDRLKTAFGINQIASEYGMTELMSQAYAPTNAMFIPPSWMRLYTRHPSDPLSVQNDGSVGLLNILDLANTSSLPFIAVDDIGKVYDSGQFEIFGRYDRSDIRGCNLMVL